VFLIFIIFSLLNICVFFFFNDTATTEIYTLSLHDALPISVLPLPEPCTICGATVMAGDDSSFEAIASTGSSVVRTLTAENESSPAMTVAPQIVHGSGKGSTVHVVEGNVHGADMVKQHPEIGAYVVSWLATTLGR